MFDKIIKFFAGEKKRPIKKVYKLPEDERFFKYVDNVVSEKLSMVLAENYRLKERIKELEAKLGKKGDKEFSEIKEKAKEMYKIQKRIDNKKRVIFKLVMDDKKLPMFFLKSNTTYKNYKYFWGIELYETDDGYTVYYPLLTDGKKVVRFKKPAVSLDSFFKEKYGMVKQLNSGKLDSNFDVDEYGNPVLLIDDEGRDIESGTKVKIINLAEQEKHKYEMEIAQLKEIINKLYSELEDSKKREVEYKRELADKDLALNVSEHEREILSSNQVSLMEKQIKMFKQLTDALLSMQDIKLSQILSQDMVDRLRETLEITRDRLDELQRESPQDYKQKLSEMYATFMDKINRLNDKLSAIGGGG